MLLFKRGIRKVIPGIVIPGIKTKYIPQFVCKDDNFRENGGKQWRACAVMKLSFPLFHSWREFCDDRSHDHNWPVLIVVFCSVGLLVSIVDIVS